MIAIRSLLHDERGAAAVEFGLIAPILGALVALIFNVWTAENGLTQMHKALDAGAEYYMAGGTDDPTAQAVTLDAWPGHPDDASITATRACKCGDTVSVCTGLCAGTQTPPSVYVTLSATGTGVGVFQHRSLSLQQVVRVR